VVNKINATEPSTARSDIAGEPNPIVAAFTQPLEYAVLSIFEDM
jgi:hypothetical protein